MNPDFKLPVRIESVCPDVFGFNTRRYSQLVQEGILPRSVKGEIDLIDATRRLIAYKDRLLEGGGSLHLTDERTRLTRIQADRKELDLKRAKGELIPTSEAMTLWGAILQNVKTRATAIPTKLTPLLYGREMAEIKATLERHIDEILNEWSSPDLEAIARMGAAASDTPNAQARAKINRKRVGRPRKSAKSGG